MAHKTDDEKREELKAYAPKGTKLYRAAEGHRYGECFVVERQYPARDGWRTTLKTKSTEERGNEDIVIYYSDLDTSVPEGYGRRRPAYIREQDATPEQLAGFKKASAKRKAHRDAERAKVEAELLRDKSVRAQNADKLNADPVRVSGEPTMTRKPNGCARFAITFTYFDDEGSRGKTRIVQKSYELGAFVQEDYVRRYEADGQWTHKARLSVVTFCGRYTSRYTAEEAIAIAECLAAAGRAIQNGEVRIEPKPDETEE